MLLHIPMFFMVLRGEFGSYKRGKLISFPIGMFFWKHLSLLFGRLGVNGTHAVVSENIFTLSSGLKIGP